MPSADREQGPRSGPRPGDPGADRLWLRAAIALSLRCPPSDSAFSVGAVLVDGSGVVLGSGFSREEDEKDHAEEVALRRAAAAARPAATPPGAALPGVATLPGGTLLEGALPGETQPELPELPDGAHAGLAGATLYSSLEPCIQRASRPLSCAELTVRAGVRRLVMAWREPPLFVPGGGADWMSAHGTTVVEYQDLAAAARAANQHLLG